jgi:ABC-type antimicrobial peptide transport system permease subunit
MKLKDIFWLGRKDLGEKRVRTTLTVLMVVIGVATIVALISLTTGLSNSIQSDLSSLGPTSIVLIAQRSYGFTAADVAAISRLDNVSSVTPLLTGSATLSYNSTNSTSVTLIGVDSANLGLLLNNINLHSGGNYSETDTHSLLLGYYSAFTSTGKERAYVNSTVTLKTASGGSTSSSSGAVVGILNEYGTTLVSVDTSVLAPLPVAESLLRRTSYNEILVKAVNSSSVSSLSTELGDIYGSNARAVNTQQIAQIASSIVGSITIMLVLIAGISLVVAAIGIMNIMLMAVMERTREIGIFKAIGFRNRDVLTMFLIQALIIGFVGGVLGVIAGAGASYGLGFVVQRLSASSATNTTSAAATAAPTVAVSTRGGGTGGTGGFAGGGGGGFGGGATVASARSGTGLTSFSPVLTVTTIAEALLVALLVSALAGIYPAWRASKMEPIEALRNL